MKFWLKKIQAVGLALMMVAGLLIVPVQAQAEEVATPCIGIDVSRYQGEIDWQQVAAAGVQFAMIRVGFRMSTTGVLNEDPYARYNLQEATKYGIKVGAYFFSSAVSAEEAVEEAEFTANILDKYQITFPVAYDCENYNKTSSRQYGLGREVRTALAQIYLNTIAQRGYTPMFYSSKSAMENNKDWNMTTLSALYKVWVAWYPEQPFPLTAACTYTGTYSMWQYSNEAAIAGIDGAVDMNVAYFNYTEVAAAKDTSGATAVSAGANVQYTDVYEVVTPTGATLNLRTTPGTESDDTIYMTISEGDMIFRTGVGNNGWSKVSVPGLDVVLYAYTSYLKKVL